MIVRSIDDSASPPAAEAVKPAPPSPLPLYPLKQLESGFRLFSAEEYLHEWQHECPKHGRGGLLLLYEKAFRFKLSGNEVDHTNSLILLVKNVLCSKLHHQKFLI